MNETNEWENVTSIPNTPGVVSKRKNISLRSVFSFSPFYGGFWPKVQTLGKGIEWLSSLLGIPTENPGLGRTPITYRSPLGQLLGLGMVGNRQAACTCLVKRKKLRYLRRKSNPRTSFTSNHSPLPQGRTSFIPDVPSPGCQEGQDWFQASLAGR